MASRGSRFIVDAVAGKTTANGETIPTDSPMDIPTTEVSAETREVRFAENDTSSLNSPTLQNTSHTVDKTYLRGTMEAVPTVSNYRDTDPDPDGPTPRKARPTMEQLHDLFDKHEDDDSHAGSKINLVPMGTGSRSNMDAELGAGLDSSKMTDGKLDETAIEMQGSEMADGDAGEKATSNLGTPANGGSGIPSSPDSAPGKGEKKAAKVTKFGWVEGVFVRCLLNIWGVMLFLRLSWIVGHAGILCTVAIIGMATVVTLITTTSMSAICTNGQVKGGGAYYMISRSLGPEFGGAIGLIFSLANCVAVAMYVAGFVETVLELYSTRFTGSAANDTRVLGILTVIILLGITQAGMAWESKMQLVLLVILVVSIINWVVGSFIYGSDPIWDQGAGFHGYSTVILKENLYPDYAGGEGFFSMFSIFFPAATGILAGSNISGDLKDASTAIPKGTFLAIIVTSAVYAAIAVTIGAVGVRRAGTNFLSNTTKAAAEYATYQNAPNCNVNATPAACDLKWTYPSSCTSYYKTPSGDPPACLGLLNDMQFMSAFSGVKAIIIAGIFAATLSSALTSLVSAPKIFQAVCKDNVFPYIGWFAKGYGVNDDPRRAFGLAFVIALGFILIGDLNTIAPIISNFFLISYCLINYSCFAASLANTPGWRPSFRFYNKWLSLLGALICGAIMFVINWWAGLITLTLVSAIYKFIDYRAKSGQLNINWGSSTQGYAYTSALNTTLNLRDVVYHVKNFRPGILVLSGSPAERPALTYLAANITKGAAIMVNGIVKQGLKPSELEKIKKTGEQWLESKKINAFVSTINAPDLLTGATSMMQTVGLGGLKPNTLFMGYKQNWTESDPENVRQYTDCIFSAFKMRYGVGILRVGDEGLAIDHEAVNEQRKKSVADASDSEQGLCAERQSIVPKQLTDAVSFFSKEGKSKQKRRIDVWWLFDDGGLVVLVAHLLKQHSPFKDADIRVFTGGKQTRVDKEKSKLIQLLQKFRIDVVEVKVLPELNKSPSDADREAMRKKIAEYRLRDNDDETVENPSYKITDHEWETLREKTHRQIKTNEMIREHSSDADLTIVSCPVAREKTSPWLYMLWLDELTKQMPKPILLLRGNQENAITFYS